MKQKLVFVLAVLLFFSCSQNKSGPKRPKEISFINENQVIQTHRIEYDSAGNIVKSTTIKQGNLAHYEKFKYGTDGKFLESELYNDQDVLLLKTKFSFDKAKNTREDKYYDAQGNLAKYYITKYKNGKLERTDQFYPDGTKYKYVEYTYKNKRLETIHYNEINSWTLTASCSYDKDNLLTGYSIAHSALKDKKMEGKFTYENGPFSESGWEILLR